MTETVCPECGERTSAGVPFCEACHAFIDWGAQAETAGIGASPRHPTATSAHLDDGAVVDRARGSDGADVPAQSRSACESGDVDARLASDRVEVEPGGSAFVEATVRNAGSVVDGSSLSLRGAPAALATVEPDRVRIYPGELDTVRVTFAVPRDSRVVAGEHGFELVVTSEQGPRSCVLCGVLAIGVFQQVNAELVPLESRGRSRDVFADVELENAGNGTASLRVEAEDPNLRLRWDDPAVVDLDPGQRAVHRVHGATARRWFGAAETFPFTVGIGAADPDQRPPIPEQRLQGRRVQLALIPRWLPPALLGVIVVAAALALLGGDDPLRVPSVLGDSRAEAVTAIEDRGLAAAVQRRFDAEVDRGLVVESDPKAGQEVEAGSRVVLFVSRGPRPDPRVTVPSLVRLTVPLARAALEERGLAVGRTIEQADPAVPAGQVIRSEPDSGDLATTGDEVTLLISTGPGPPEQATVPDVTTWPIVDAETELRDAGFAVTRAQEISGDVPEGAVVRTDPPGGLSVDIGSEVTVHVSTGPAPVSVPDVAGSDVAGAETLLTSGGLRLEDRVDVLSAEVPSGRVVRSEPSAGREVAPGTGVILVVSSGEAGESPLGVACTEARSASELLSDEGLTPGSSVALQRFLAAAGSAVDPDLRTRTAPVRAGLEAGDESAAGSAVADVRDYCNRVGAGE